MGFLGGYVKGKIWLGGLGLATVLMLGAGCKDDEADAPSDGVEDLTIVVEADKSRILQEEQDLQEKRSTVEQERERLSKERSDVEQKLASLSKKDKKQRDELEGEQKRLADEERRMRERSKSFESERSKLEDEKTKLLDRISKMTATKGGLTIEQREQLIAQREKDVAARERAVAERERGLAHREGEVTKRLAEATRAIGDLQGMGGITKTVVVNQASAPSNAPAQVTRAAVQKLQRQVRSSMDQKGLLMDDLPPAAKDAYKSANDAINSKDYASAYESLSEVQSMIESVQINQAFVSAKMSRLNRLAEKKSLDQTGKQLLNDISDAANDGRYDRANRKINQVWALINK